MSWLRLRQKRELEKARINMMRMNQIISDYETIATEQNALIEELTKNNQIRVELNTQQDALIQAHESHIQKQKETILEMKSIIENQAKKLAYAGVESIPIPNNPTHPGGNGGDTHAKG